jgi:tetratricopeptide (TPR) repeat protein
MIMFNEHIQDYIEDRLEGEEKLAFEKRLETEITFKKDYVQELARHKALQATMRAEAKAELKKMLGQSTPVRSIKPMWRASAIAAAILILILAGYLLIPQQKSPEQLAMSHFEPYPLSNIRGKTNDQQTLFDKAIAPYQQGDFEKALPFLRQLHQADPSHPQLKLNLASGLMAEGQPKEAISLLKTISGPGADAAEWYLALAYLQDGQVDTAKILLQEISGKSHFRQEQAMELLGDL